MSLQVYLNGQLVPKQEARISVWDHGLLYGDGIFEGIRIYGGRVFRLDEHLERLYESAHSIRLKIPLSLAEMREAVLATCRANDLPDAYIRLVVTRGEGDLGIDRRKCHKATVIIIVDQIHLYPPDKYETGMRLIVASTRQSRHEILSPKVKSLNYLNNILAKMEGEMSAADEVIMLNTEGYVTECTADNVFIVKDGELLTPASHAGLLEGVTRDVVLELAGEMEIPAHEALLAPHDLYVADEVFLTGTGAEMIAVVEIEGRMIGEGKPGPITRRLLAAFRELAAREGVPYSPAGAVK